VLVVVRLLAASSVPNDGVAVAERTVPRQLRQTDADYPGSALSSTTGSAIKRITAGVKACRWSYRQVRAGDRPSPSCTNQCRTRRETVHPHRCRYRSLRMIGRFKTVCRGSSVQPREVGSAGPLRGIRVGCVANSLGQTRGRRLSVPDGNRPSHLI
jgi:hypothetical protein